MKHGFETGRGWPDGYNYQKKSTATSTRKRYSKMTRTRVKTHASQNGHCHYCKLFVVLGKWTIDHIVPLVRGGTNESSNLIGCCSTCNGKKANLTEAEYLSVQNDSKARKRLINQHQLECLKVKLCFPR